MDVRPRIAAVPGQEVLTADGIAVKVSLVAQYQITDPVVAVNGQANYEGSLYTGLQLVIRRVISAEPIDSLLEKGPRLAEQLLALAQPDAARLGLSLLQADVKDLTLPGELKKLFTQVTKARQEGLASLEGARGETAALRNLANAARLVSDNPALIQLRLLQVVGEQSGNTVVLGVPPSSAPLPIATPPRDRIQPPPTEPTRGVGRDERADPLEAAAREQPDGGSERHSGRIAPGVRAEPLAQRAVGFPETQGRAVGAVWRVARRPAPSSPGATTRSLRGR